MKKYSSNLFNFTVFFIHDMITFISKLFSKFMLLIILVFLLIFSDPFNSVMVAWILLGIYGLCYLFIFLLFYFLRASVVLISWVFAVCVGFFLAFKDKFGENIIFRSYCFFLQKFAIFMTFFVRNLWLYPSLEHDYFGHRSKELEFNFFQKKKDISDKPGREMASEFIPLNDKLTLFFPKYIRLMFSYLTFSKNWTIEGTLDDELAKKQMVKYSKRTDKFYQKGLGFGHFSDEIEAVFFYYENEEFNDYPSNIDYFDSSRVMSAVLHSYPYRRFIMFYNETLYSQNKKEFDRFLFKKTNMQFFLILFLFLELFLFSTLWICYGLLFFFLYVFDFLRLYFRRGFKLLKIIFMREGWRLEKVRKFFYYYRNGVLSSFDKVYYGVWSLCLVGSFLVRVIVTIFLNLLFWFLSFFRFNSFFYRKKGFNSSYSVLKTLNLLYDHRYESLFFIVLVVSYISIFGAGVFSYSEMYDEIPYLQADPYFSVNTLDVIQYFEDIYWGLGQWLYRTNKLSLLSNLYWIGHFCFGFITEIFKTFFYFAGLICHFFIVDLFFYILGFGSDFFKGINPVSVYGNFFSFFYILFSFFYLYFKVTLFYFYKSINVFFYSYMHQSLVYFLGFWFYILSFFPVILSFIFSLYLKVKLFLLYSFGIGFLNFKGFFYFLECCFFNYFFYISIFFMISLSISFCYTFLYKKSYTVSGFRKSLFSFVLFYFLLGLSFLLLVFVFDGCFQLIRSFFVADSFENLFHILYVLFGFHMIYDLLNFFVSSGTLFFYIFHSFFVFFKILGITFFNVIFDFFINFYYFLLNVFGVQVVIFSSISSLFFFVLWFFVNFFINFGYFLDFFVSSFFIFLGFVLEFVKSLCFFFIEFFLSLKNSLSPANIFFYYPEFRFFSSFLVYLGEDALVGASGLLYFFFRMLTFFFISEDYLKSLLIAEQIYKEAGEAFYYIVYLFIKNNILVHFYILKEGLSMFLYHLSFIFGTENVVYYIKVFYYYYGLFFSFRGLGLLENIIFLVLFSIILVSFSRLMVFLFSIYFLYNKFEGKDLSTFRLKSMVNGFDLRERYFSFFYIKSEGEGEGGLTKEELDAQLEERTSQDIDYFNRNLDEMKDAYLNFYKSGIFEEKGVSGLDLEVYSYLRPESRLQLGKLLYGFFTAKGDEKRLHYLLLIIFSSRNLFFYFYYKFFYICFFIKEYFYQTFLVGRPDSVYSLQKGTGYYGPSVLPKRYFSDYEKLYEGSGSFSFFFYFLNPLIFLTFFKKYVSYYLRFLFVFLSEIFSFFYFSNIFKSLNQIFFFIKNISFFKVAEGLDASSYRFNKRSFFLVRSKKLVPYKELLLVSMISFFKEKPYLWSFFKKSFDFFSKAWAGLWSVDFLFFGFYALEFCLFYFFSNLFLIFSKVLYFLKHLFFVKTRLFFVYLQIVRFLKVPRLGSFVKSFFFFRKWLGSYVSFFNLYKNYLNVASFSYVNYGYKDRDSEPDLPFYESAYRQVRPGLEFGYSKATRIGRISNILFNNRFVRYIRAINFVYIPKYVFNFYNISSLYTYLYFKFLYNTHAEGTFYYEISEDNILYERHTSISVWDRDSSYAKDNNDLSKSFVEVVYAFFGPRTVEAYYLVKLEISKRSSLIFGCLKIFFFEYYFVYWDYFKLRYYNYKINYLTAMLDKDISKLKVVYELSNNLYWHQKNQKMGPDQSFGKNNSSLYRQVDALARSLNKEEVVDYNEDFIEEILFMHKEDQKKLDDLSFFDISKEEGDNSEDFDKRSQEAVSENESDYILENLEVLESPKLGSGESSLSKDISVLDEVNRVSESELKLERLRSVLNKNKVEDFSQLSLDSNKNVSESFFREDKASYGFGKKWFFEFLDREKEAVSWKVWFYNKVSYFSLSLNLFGFLFVILMCYLSFFYFSQFFIFFLNSFFVTNTYFVKGILVFSFCGFVTGYLFHYLYNKFPDMMYYYVEYTFYNERGYEAMDIVSKFYDRLDTKNQEFSWNFESAREYYETKVKPKTVTALLNYEPIDHYMRFIASRRFVENWARYNKIPYVYNNLSPQDFKEKSYLFYRDKIVYESLNHVLMNEVSSAYVKQNLLKLEDKIVLFEKAVKEEMVELRRIAGEQSNEEFFSIEYPEDMEGLTDSQKSILRAERFLAKKDGRDLTEKERSEQLARATAESPNFFDYYLDGDRDKKREEFELRYQEYFQGDELAKQVSSRRLKGIETLKLFKSGHGGMNWDTEEIEFDVLRRYWVHEHFSFTSVDEEDEEDPLDLTQSEVEWSYDDPHMEWIDDTIHSVKQVQLFDQEEEWVFANGFIEPAFFLGLSAAIYSIHLSGFSGDFYAPMFELDGFGWKESMWDEALEKFRYKSVYHGVRSFYEHEKFLYLLDVKLTNSYFKGHFGWLRYDFDVEDRGASHVASDIYDFIYPGRDVDGPRDLTLIEQNSRGLVQDDIAYKSRNPSDTFVKYFDRFPW